MARIELSIRYTLDNEKGFVNRADDKGGPTNLGITLPILGKFLGRQVGIEDLQLLTLKNVIPIYQEFFWLPLKLDQVNDQNMATAIFDIGVNEGQVTDVKLVQQACNECGATLEVDGCIGSATVQALNLQSRPQWIRAYQGLVANHYRTIGQSNPNFVNGWLARAARLSTLV